MAWRRRVYVALAASAACAAIAPAYASPDARRQVHISGGNLSEALAEFGRETGAELLFDRRLVGGLLVSPVRGRLSPRETLSRLLAGTPIKYRDMGGTFVLYRPIEEPDASFPDELPIPEILVTGRRSHNADIRRTENDIQPYKVSTRDRIQGAHRTNVEEFLRSRVPANSQASTRAQDLTNGDPGNVRSAVDLRGLGSRRTLVLVDGRRLPSPVGSGNEFDQGDLNGIPLSAVERIETLTGTAGGIHGPGALGGVINVVLRRDFKGADLSVTSGISSRGDAKRLQVDGRIGFSANEGRTALMLSASHQTSEPLLAGQRDFQRRAREKQFAYNPLGFVKLLNASNAITVLSGDGADLILDQEFGGANLGASYSYMPLGFSGTRAEAVALLEQNAGKIDLSLAADHSGTLKSVLSTAKVTSGLINLRHRPSDQIELFIEGLAYRNDGNAVRGRTSFPTTTSRNAPTNPFAQRVYFLYPQPVAQQRRHVTSETKRVSAGIIAKWSNGWSGTADYTLGSSQQKARLRGPDLGSRYNRALDRGTPSQQLPSIDPLGDWEQLVAATTLYQEEFGIASGARNRLREASLRLAGPLLHLEAGPVVLSLLAQHRVQRVAAPDLSLTIGGNVFATKLPSRKQAVGSGYAELRAPLLAENARFLPGLEVQLAARYDRASISSVTSNGEDQQFRPDIRVNREGLNYTLGAKFPIFPRLMFRASVATGEQYPTIGQLTPARDVVQSPESAVRTTPDPKRGGQPIGGGGPVLFLFGGDPGLKSERALSLSFGFILNPSSLKGPRISIDYSRIDRRQEVVLFPLSPAELLTREADYPGRVLRAGLSQADIPLGFEAGPVTTIDIRPVNEGSTIVEALEVELNWKIPLISGSEIQLYGSGSWQPQLKTRLGAGRPWLKRLGFFDGPSAWRGNIGAEWTLGSLAVGVNLQAFSGYRITFANPGNVDGVIFNNEELLSYQGRNWVPSQAYVDLAARRRFHLGASGAPLRTLEVRFGIQNLLDKPPPTVASPYAVPYSTYGDARLRRFELTLASRF